MDSFRNIDIELCTYLNRTVLDYLPPFDPPTIIFMMSFLSQDVKETRQGFSVFSRKENQRPA